LRPEFAFFARRPPAPVKCVEDAAVAAEEPRPPEPQDPEPLRPEFAFFARRPLAPDKVSERVAASAAEKTAGAAEGVDEEAELELPADGEVSDAEAEEDLGRLRANAAGAWLLNIALVLWISWLYKQTTTDDVGVEEEMDLTSQYLAGYLSQQLRDDSDALDSDAELKKDLLQEAGAMASLARRIEEVVERKAAANRQDASSLMLPVVRELQMKVRSAQAVFEQRDATLLEGFEQTKRSLVDVTDRAWEARPVAEDAIFGPLTSGASGVLAGVDLSFALESFLLAVLLSVAKRSFDGGEKAASPSQASQPENRAAASDGRADAKESLTAPGARRARTVMRLYGRWDDDQDWLLLRTLPLSGTPEKVLRVVHRSRPWFGRLSDQLLRALVTRAARGLVKRRGWTRVALQTEREVGSNFVLGFLLETAADKAAPVVAIDSEKHRVLEVPTAGILDES